MVHVVLQADLLVFNVDHPAAFSFTDNNRSPKDSILSPLVVYHLLFISKF
jgi:hypothetical protein